MLQKCSKEKVLSVFFEEPTTKHYLKEISKKSKIAHTSVKKILKELIKEKIIIEKNEKRGKRIFPVFYSNLNYERFKIIKKINNLKDIYESGLISKIENEFMPKAIVLFGSYCFGEDIEESDIDLFVEAKEKKIDLKKFEKKLKRKINLFFKQNFNKISSGLKENIINGIVLQGAIELR
jgi:predicted nucleotidyltransferase